MFVSDKSLMVIIFMYSVGFMLFAGQYLVGDVFGLQITSFDGKTPIKSNLLNILQTGKLQTFENTLNVTASNQGNYVANVILSAGTVAFEVALLGTGTYVFYMLGLFGIPVVVIAPLVTLYIILLARTLLSYIRGSI